MSVLAMLSTFGANAPVIWEFAVGVLKVTFASVLIIMAVTFMIRLINQ